MKETPVALSHVGFGGDTRSLIALKKLGFWNGSSPATALVFLLLNKHCAEFPNRVHYVVVPPNSNPEYISASLSSPHFGGLREWGLDVTLSLRPVS